MIKISINNMEYHDWENISITRSIENLCGAFSMSVTNQRDVLIGCGDSCKIYEDNIILQTAYVEKISQTSNNSSGRNITVSGRCVTCDLIDCSVVTDGKNITGEWKKQKAENIIRDLIKPFGLTLDVRVDTGDVFETYNIEQGSKIYDSINKICKARSLLSYTNENGVLVLEKAGENNASGSLEQGANIKSCDLTYDETGLYSQYVTKGQQKRTYSKDPATSTQVVSSVTDKGIKRYRPLVLISDEETNNLTAENRAQWEWSIRRAKSELCNITTSFFLINKHEWKINTLCRVIYPSFNIDKTYLIKELEFTLNKSDGGNTKLVLCDVGAYQ
jgi:prophage tail gpP-like protein